MSGSGSLERGLAVLMAIADAGEIDAATLAEAVHLPGSTVYRYLRTLREHALVEEHGGRYVAGWRLLSLAGPHLVATRLADLGGQSLRTLHAATGETAVLTVRAGTQAICLRQVASTRAERDAFVVNQLLPLHAGAGQRVLLAYAPAAVINAVLANPLAYTPGTLGAEQLRAEVTRIRREGFAVSRAELTEGIAVAVPVRHRGEVVCSLAIAGPLTRCDRPAWVRRALTLLRAETAGLEARLDDELPVG